MIAKLPPKRKDGKSSFKDLIDYICGRDANRAIYVGTRKLSSLESAEIEMETVAFSNVRCKDPVFHFILSWRELEYPTNAQVDEAVGIALAELDLQNCQALWALQADTENRHAHVAVNRIDPETGRAIQPAGNWTHKALERAARKIEAAQGWEILSGGNYKVTADGTVKETEQAGEREKQEKQEKKFSQTAKDIEAHTAAKSAERIGKETAGPIIRAAKSWEELHKNLAARGILFERKGGGAILKIGETAAVKASHISRDMSLSKLEARLGPYRESGGREAENPSPSLVEPIEPIEKVEKEPRVKSSWERYRQAREDYFETKRKTASELRERQKKERSALQKKQKDERTWLFMRSWKGRGRELNQRRSVIAAAQQTEKLDLRDRQKEEQERLKKLFPYRFPNFKTWLDRETNPELSTLFRYPDDPVMLGASDSASVRDHSVHDRSVRDRSDALRPDDLRAFTATWGNKNGVAYCRKGKGGAGKNPEFVDYGKKILLSKDCGETTILAALQLASQKWGTVQISGTEEYKRLCAELAAKHNLRIAGVGVNLAPRPAKNEEGRAKLIEESKTLFERYANAVGAERFRIVVTDFSRLPQEDGVHAGGTRAFVFDKKSDGLEGKTREGILESVSKLLQYEDYGKNINVVPLSSDKHHILIDDMNVQSLEQLKQDGYRPSCVVESSPGNFQAILTIPSLDGDIEKDREAANKLTKDLNLRYGDPKLSGAIHAHRLPPFANRKSTLVRGRDEGERGKKRAIFFLF